MERFVPAAMIPLVQPIEKWREVKLTKRGYCKKFTIFLNHHRVESKAGFLRVAREKR